VTKLEAAEIAMNCGGVTVIAHGGRIEVLTRIFAGGPEGTVFLTSTRMKGKRRWLAHAAGVRGRVVVDAGGQHAVTRGKASLLSSNPLRNKELENDTLSRRRGLGVSAAQTDRSKASRSEKDCISLASPGVQNALRRYGLPGIAGRNSMFSPGVAAEPNARSRRIP
jgi:hypothetical protein